MQHKLKNGQVDNQLKIQMGGFINITDDDDDAFVVMYGIVSDFNRNGVALCCYYCFMLQNHTLQVQEFIISNALIEH